MGKGELWDDSALIKAFDEAIFKYKKVHGKDSKENTNGLVGDLKSSSGDAYPADNDTEEEGESHLQTDNEGKNDDALASVKLIEAQAREKENEVASSQLRSEEGIGSNNLPIQDEARNISSSLDVDEYNQLYRHYYEVEEQRQKILQKLQNFSWSYADGAGPSVSGVEWANASATPEYQSSTTQVPCGTMVVSCCPYTCPCSMVSCSSLPCSTPIACTSAPSNDASPLMGCQEQSAVDDTDFVKMAMGAAERAISTLKDSTPDWKGDNNVSGGTETTTSPQTDLSTVLNAWYSAGFYTGKYLTEHSVAKKRHG